MLKISFLSLFLEGLPLIQHRSIAAHSLPSWVSNNYTTRKGEEGSYVSALWDNPTSWPNRLLLLHRKQLGFHHSALSLALNSWAPGVMKNTMLNHELPEVIKMRYSQVWSTNRWWKNCLNKPFYWQGLFSSTKRKLSEPAIFTARPRLRMLKKIKKLKLKKHDVAAEQH